MLSGAIRVKFQKTGNLQFISHLDLMRFMTKALVRAKIPVVYSEGFNPHPKITFGLPLSVGTESVCELMEMKIDREMEAEEIRERLNAAMPPELSVSEVYAVPCGVKLSAIAWAAYEIQMDRVVDGTILGREEIFVRKQTKSSEKTINIAPLIKRYRQEENVLHVVLCADSASYLNPELIVKLFDVEDYSIRRVACYCADAETEFR